MNKEDKLVNEKREILKREGTKSLMDLKPEDKWDILTSYIQLKEPHLDIATRHRISERDFRRFISTLYKKFQVARETKVLIASGNRPDLFQILREREVSSEHINKNFINLLSESEDPFLSDNEIIFCEYLIETGDTIKALEESRLNIGLKDAGSKDFYQDACLARAFYLKKKDNIQKYLERRNEERLTEIKDGKTYVQQKLIKAIEQLENSNDARSRGHFFKAVEQYARTIGAFDDKITVNSVDGDKVLDMMLEKAKKVKVKELPQDEQGRPDVIAYVDGEEIYEERR